MIKKEPYIGMPIILGEVEDTAMAEIPVEIVTRAEIAEASDAVDAAVSDVLDDAADVSAAPASALVTAAEIASAKAGTAAEPDAAREVMASEPSSMGRTMPQTPQMPMPQMPGQQPMVVGMAYVPWQRWQQPFNYETAFEKGTIFPDLDLPFLGYQRGQRR